MCTLVLLRRPGHEWPVILGANRDEMVGRPWKAPGRHWDDRPNVVAGQDPNAGPKKSGEWLNPNGFQRITQDPNSPVQQFGSAGRNIAQGPGYTDWDFSLFKNIRVAESAEVQFRAEFFNILNHTNFHNPDSDMNSQTFNQILEAQPPRLIQFALKLTF